MASAAEFTNGLDTILTDWAKPVHAVTDGTTQGKPVYGSKPPVNITALSLKQDITAWLASLCRLVIEERGLDTRNLDGTDTPRMCAWLKNHVEWVAWHEAGDSFADELNGCPRPKEKCVDGCLNHPGLVARLHTLVEPPAPKGVRIGDCPDCGRPVHHLKGATEIRCECGRVGPRQWWMDALGVPRYLTDRRVAVMLSTVGKAVSPTAVRMMASRGRLQRHVIDGRTLFDSEEVLDMVKARYEDNAA